jgi:phosphoacetylglucosamine mutase
MELVPNENLNLDAVEKKLIVDGANGVGGSKLEEIKKNIKGLEIDVRNTGKEDEGLLNEACGADFVQKEKFAPIGFCLNDLSIR